MAHAALRLCRERPADVVLTHLHMPEVDGIEFTRQLSRAASFNPAAG